MTKCYAQVRLDGTWRTVDANGMVSMWRTSFNVCNGVLEAQKRLMRFYPTQEHRIIGSTLTSFVDVG